MNTYIYNTGAWEPGNLDSVINTLDRYMKTKKIKKASDLTILDMGANVGFYTFALSAKGYKVASFEPSIENIYLLRRSLCANPELKILLINVGLGNVEETCVTYSGPTEFSNRYAFCNGTAPSGMVYRGKIQITRLDHFSGLFNNIVFIKIDIEGYEIMAVSEGKKIFFDLKVPYIIMEFVWDRLVERGGSPGEFLAEFHKNGYDIRNTSFVGPIYSLESLKVASTFPEYLDLFFTHRETSV